jgi:PAT family beta-lactamase induction signal transducer AmpG
MRRDRIGPAHLALGLSLYALQGLVVAYLFNFNKAYMASSGVSLASIARVQSLALLPLALKFLAGPLSDRFNLLHLGHRRPFIALGALAQSVGLSGLALIDSGANLGLFAASAVLAVAGLGLYDTCADGLIVDATPASDRARVQGLLWGSRFLAAMLGTLAFGAWLERLGSPALADRLIWACVALGLVPFALALATPDPARPPDAEVFDWRALRVLVRPLSLALIAFGAWYGMIGLGVETNLSPFYASLGFGVGGDVGRLGAARYLGRAVGALALPLLASRFRRGRVLAFGVVLLAVSIAGQALVRGPIDAALWAFLFGAANGGCDAAFALLAMEAADPRLAASTFALFMAVTNLSSIGDAGFHELTERVGGFDAAFVTASLAALCTLALVPILSRPHAGPPSTSTSTPEPRHGPG